jgi:hypothetical protein
MASFKQSVRKILPTDIYQSLRSGRDALSRMADLPGVLLHPWKLASNRRILKYQNQYSGKRCFVIGNGPSLKNMDLSFLKNEITFGMNRVYLAFDEWQFQTSFLVSINDLVIEQSRDDLNRLAIPKFFSWRSRNLLFPEGQPDDNTHFLYTTYSGPKFSKHLQSRFWEGATVTYVCLQLAYCMGFDEVYLIGVDHNFDTRGKANQTVISSGDDPNHFSPEYFGKGFRWQLPDLETSEKAYWIADNNFRHDNRQILDATIDGKLTVFPKIVFSELVDGDLGKHI